MLQGYGVDAAAIILVIIVNALIGYVQEGKVEKALEAIRNMVAPRAAVLRDGKRLTIDADRIVPGDLVILEPGDRVPADLRDYALADAFMIVVGFAVAVVPEGLPAVMTIALAISLTDFDKFMEEAAQKSPAEPAGHAGTNRRNGRLSGLGQRQTGHRPDNLCGCRIQYQRIVAADALKNRLFILRVNRLALQLCHDVAERKMRFCHRVIASHPTRLCYKILGRNPPAYCKLEDEADTSQAEK